MGCQCHNHKPSTEPPLGIYAGVMVIILSIAGAVLVSLWFVLPALAALFWTFVQIRAFHIQSKRRP